MKSVKQFFRADHVGSLLRPETIKNCREKYFANKTISKSDLKEIEDEEIINVIKMQEKIGFKVVTDGEFRRSWWHYDFIENLNGIELEQRETGVKFSGTNLRPFFPIVTDNIDFPIDHPMIEHFKFVKNNTNAVPKISIPGPSCCHFRTTPDDIFPSEYKDTDVLFSDIANTYKKAVKAFYDIGC